MLFTNQQCSEYIHLPFREFPPRSFCCGKLRQLALQKEAWKLGLELQLYQLEEKEWTGVITQLPNCRSAFLWGLPLCLWRFVSYGLANVNVSAFPFSLSLCISISLLLIGSNKIPPATRAVVLSASNPLIPLDTQESLAYYSTTAFCKCCTPPQYSKLTLCCDQRRLCPQSSKCQHSYGSWLHFIPCICAAEVLEMSPSKTKSLWKLNIFFSQRTGLDTLLK